MKFNNAHVECDAAGKNMSNVMLKNLGCEELFCQ